MDTGLAVHQTNSASTGCVHEIIQFVIFLRSYTRNTIGLLDKGFGVIGSHNVLRSMRELTFGKLKLESDLHAGGNNSYGCMKYSSSIWLPLNVTLV